MDRVEVVSRRWRHWRSVAIAAGVATAVGLGGSLPARAEVSSTGTPIRNLGTLPGGTFSAGYGINALGEVAGKSDATDGNLHAVRFEPGGAVTDLGTGDANSQSAEALAVNNARVAVGDSLVFGNTHALRWSASGHMTVLGFLPNGSISKATGINSSGWISGYSDGPPSSGCCGTNHAVTWSPSGAITDLGTLPGGSYSQGLGINDRNQVAGVSNDSSGVLHAVVWNRSGAITDLGIPEGGRSIANAISNTGEVAGTWYPSGSPRQAVRWSAGGTRTDLPSLCTCPSEGFGINDLGQVVGSSNGNRIPTFWAKGKAPVNLGVLSGMTRAVAEGINDAGQVSGFSGGPSGQFAVAWSAPGTISRIFWRAFF